jgi:hypothetical protein
MEDAQYLRLFTDQRSKQSDSVGPGLSLTITSKAKKKKKKIQGVKLYKTGTSLHPHIVCTLPGYRGNRLIC